MPKRVDSDALTPVQDQIGISGSAGQFTEFEEDSLIQVFDANSAIRRGRADIAGGGLFFGLLRNNHAGSDDEVSTVDPYKVGAALATETWPDTVSDKFDVWVLGCSFNLSSGGANNGAIDVALEIDMTITDRLRAFGVDDTGAVAAGGGTLTLAFADSRFSAGGAIRFMNGQTEAPWFPIGLRMPRQESILRFLSTKGDAGVGVWDCIMLLGLFPVGMGQDVASP